MSKNKGAKIYLVSGTRILKWIRMQDLNVTIKKRKMGKGCIRILTIKGGEADFYGGGGVGVTMPGCSGFWVAFAPLKVLKITDLKGKIIESNYYFCDKCFTNTGKVIKSEKSKDTGVWDFFDKTFECSFCGNQWERKRI